MAIMDIRQALDFLKKHQPMPGDEPAEGFLLDTYKEVMDFFLINQNEECVPLFLNSFGSYDGFGVYQLVGDVITKYPSDIVVPALIDAITNGADPVKSWCAEIAYYFPDDRLIDCLGMLTSHENLDIRWPAILALSKIDSNRIMELFGGLLLTERDQMAIDEMKAYIKQ